MLRLITAFFVVIWPAISCADGYAPTLPAFYDVAGVAVDDSLNVRLEPGADAPIVGKLAPDATDLQVVLLSLEGNWAYLNLGEQSGWVSRRFLERQLPEKDRYGLPPTLSCFGTEPFWSVDFTPEGLTLTTPEGSTTHAITATAPSREHVMLNVMGFRFEWRDSDQTVTGHILPGLCNDGMNSAVFGLHYVDTRSATKGCCSL